MTAYSYRANQIGWDGQSLVYSPGVLTQAVPYGVWSSLTHNTLNSIVALPATTWGQRALDATKRVDSLLGRVPGINTFAEIGGTSNVDYPMTAAQALIEAQSYWNARKAAGWDFVIVTTVPDSISFDDGEDGKRAELNGLILGSTVPDAVVNLTGVPELEDHTSAAFSDGVHLTAFGVTLIVPLYLAAYQGLVP